MLQAADAVDSSEPAGLAKTDGKKSSKARNLNKALLTATVLITLDIERGEQNIC